MSRRPSNMSALIPVVFISAACFGAGIMLALPWIWYALKPILHQMTAP